MTRRDIESMAQALRLASKGRFTARPNPMVGCVIANPQGEWIGQGYHLRAGEAHAEVNALEQAGDQARGATAYVSLEPCCHEGRTGPCTEALINAGIQRVICAMEDPNPLVAGQGVAALRERGIEIHVGLLQDQAESLNRGFIKRMRKGLPWVTVKTAASLDGRTALANGASKWITSEAARKDVHRLRAQNCVMITGIGTVLADDPSMNVRIAPEYIHESLVSTPIANPLRVILDTQLRLPEDAKILQQEGSTLVYTLNKDERKQDRLRAQGAEVICVASSENKLSITMILEDLAKRQINNVLVEAGPTLVGSFLDKNAVDDLYLYMAASFLGDSANGIARIPSLTNMQDRIELNIEDVRTIGSDLRIYARIGN